MAQWFRSLIGKSPGGGRRARRVLELLAHEGDDAGERFTVDGDEVLIGRRLEEEERVRGIRLRDSTVSSRQAVIRRDAGEVILQHLAEATNPTLLDGQEIESAPLYAGSNIRIGRVRLEVCERQGVALGNLTEVYAGGSFVSGATPQADRQREVADQTTRARVSAGAWGSLSIERGESIGSQVRFPIESTCTRLGRSEMNDVRLRDMGVSREHAELVLDGEDLILHHKSRVNPTLLNGVELSSPMLVEHNDVIQLADRVVLRVQRRSGLEGEREAVSPERMNRGLGQRMEARVVLDREIEENYRVQGSFLDLDVVNSYGMKADGQRPDHIVVSFERFRKYVGDLIEHHSGLVLNSNGDELMCFFESPMASVDAAIDLLATLEDFNREKNLLSRPFQFRIGIHTGRSLVDLDRGVAYSSILDAAGHLQKLALPDGLVISQSTLDALSPGVAFEYTGILERSGFAYYRFVGNPAGQPLGG